MRAFRIALGFLTTIPTGARQSSGRSGPARPSTVLSPAAVLWFPVVGALVGGIVGSAWLAGAEVFSPSVAAAVTIAVDLLVTGALHYDGLADAADGLLPHMERSKRLTVMTEPTVGAFAVVATMLVVLLRWSALTSLEPSVVLILSIWASSRALAALGLLRLPMARPDGLAARFQAQPDGRSVPVLVAMVVVATVSLGLTGGWAMALLVIGPAMLATMGLFRLSVSRLGGITGDVLGAGIVLAETVAVVAASALQLR